MELDRPHIKERIQQMTLLWLQGGGLREEDRGDAQRQCGDEWWMQKETMRDGTSGTQRTEMLHRDASDRNLWKTNVHAFKMCLLARRELRLR